MKIFICILSIFIGGCTTHIIDLSMISNKNIALDKIKLDNVSTQAEKYALIKKRIDPPSQRKMIEGEDSRFGFLFGFLSIPFGQPRIENAVSDALKRGNGDLIIDASIYLKQLGFLIGFTSIQIKGTVVSIKGAR